MVIRLRNTRQSGFSVTEAVIVVLVLSLIGFVVFRVVSSSEDAEDNNTEATGNNENIPELETTPFIFTAAGDFDSTKKTDAVLTKLAASDSEFTLGLGDLGYLGPYAKEESWCNFVKERVGSDYPFELLVGNHDDGGVDGNIRDFIECLPNQLEGIMGDYGVEYYFDYNNLARFIMIAPDIDSFGFEYNEGSENYNWVVERIDEARSAGIKWVVLSMHKNCITPGQKPCEVNQDIFNKAIEMKVDLILQGHEHAYFRSKQLVLGELCPAIVVEAYNEECVSNQGSSFTKDAGAIIVISGAGGKALRDARLDDPEINYFDSINAKNVGNTYGFSRFEVSENEILAEFVPADGSFTDSFVIQ